VALADLAERSRVASVARGNETRKSLLTPFGSPLSISIELPGAPRLRTGIAIDGSAGTPGVLFRIDVGERDETETVFEERLPREEGSEWRDREVDLSRWSGRRVTLTFRADPPERLARRPERLKQARGRVTPVWGTPVVAPRDGAGALRSVILVSLDCVRADHTSVHGYPRETTPRLARFAEDGVVFEQAMSAAPSTLPSHMTMFSGLTPALHGASKWTGLSPAVEVLPEILDQRGFETHAVVSAPYLHPGFGFDRGFDSYLTKIDARADGVVDAAIEKLAFARGSDFFLFLHVFDAHWPYDPPASYRERFAPRPRDISALLDLVKLDRPPRDQGDVQAMKDLYDAEIAYTDGEFGRFLDELDARGLYEGSLILVTADHGETFYEHGHWQHSRTLYDELLHVPLVVKWPGNRLFGRSGSIASHVDILPTVLADLGLVPDEALRGVDLAGLAGREESSRAAVSEYVWLLPEGIRARFSFRTREHRYIATVTAREWKDISIDSLDGEELYATSDAREERDLANSEEDIVRRFRETLSSYLAEVRRRREVRGETRTLDEETERRLRSLGYVYN
jgi:arylsulfatase A-like enzyme